MEIRWRPSGGRGEYEYATAEAHLQGKRILVEVPGLNVRIPTDVRFDFVDGKRRLRRDAPNDRNILNFPPLVAAIAGLPEPQREDKGTFAYPLQHKGYVLDVVLSEVIAESKDTVVLLPRALKPRHAADFIDLDERMQALKKVANESQQVSELLAQLKVGVNSAVLSAMANTVHQIFPYAPGKEVGHVSQETDDIVDDYVGKEGKERIRMHRYKERDKKIVAKAKALFKAKYQSLFCECCGISFGDSYKPLGADFIEAHHRVPLESLTGESEVKPEDLVMLCPNCHRMVHKSATCSVEEIRKILKSNGYAANQGNLNKLTSKSK